MRDAFVRALLREMEKDPRVTLITGDLGFGVLRPVRETYPDRFVNAGIAEQAMTGLAAGLARTGRTVLTYSIGNFPTLRCLEQIRNDCAYHGANVKIVCVGGGFVYGSLGMSHHATEDMAVMRAIPGITCFTPGDPAETEAVVPVMLPARAPAICAWDGATSHGAHEGDAGLGLAPGACACGREGHRPAVRGRHPDRRQRAAELAGGGHQAEVVCFPCLKPMDRGDGAGAGGPLPDLITVEENTVVGGFGSAVCEIVAGNGMRMPGTPDGTAGHLCLRGGGSGVPAGSLRNQRGRHRGEGGGCWPRRKERMTRN